MQAISILLLVVCVVIVVLPPKWDPAIRLKEWNIKQADKLNERR